MATRNRVLLLKGLALLLPRQSTSQIFYLSKSPWVALTARRTRLERDSRATLEVPPGRPAMPLRVAASQGRKSSLGIKATRSSTSISNKEVSASGLDVPRSRSYVFWSGLA